MILVEAVPASVGRMLSKTVSVPVIGIGAGVDTDGQVLVLHDMLGLSLSGHTPNCAQLYVRAGEYWRSNQIYVSAVKTVHFRRTLLQECFVPHC
jgi:3-methyl-2-oxobutanoate hydroxymethyltransferase